MDKGRSFVFPRQYRNCFSQRINALVPRNGPIKRTISMMMHDFHALKTMTFHYVADIAYFWFAVTEIIWFFHSIYRLRPVPKHSWKLEKSKIDRIWKFKFPSTTWFKPCSILYPIEIGWPTPFDSSHENWQTGRFRLVYSYLCTLHPILWLEVSGNLSYVKFISTVRQFCEKTQLIHPNTIQKRENLLVGSVTVTNDQIELSQSTNFSRIQDGAWL